MKEKHPDRLNPLSPQLRTEALSLLHSKGRFALGEIEKLMGWQGPVGIGHRIMAQQLGVTERRLRYLIERHWLREQEKEQRLAESDAEKVVLAAHLSHKLRFSISLPENWRVITDTLEWSPLAQEHLDYLVRSKPAKTPTRIYARVTDEGGIRSLTEFEARRAAQEEHKERIAAAERHARLEQMAIGLFQAEPPADDDRPFVEVTKLQLDSPLKAIDIYRMNKSLPEIVPSGSRPNNGMVVDGISGVVYYFTMRLVGELSQEWPRFFNVYLTEGDEGWILSCQTSFKAFDKYKPIFRRIIGSFRRLRTV